MKRFNLLPSEIQKKQARHKTIIKLIVAQVFIAIFILCSFPAFSFISDAVALRSQELTRLISEPKYTESDALVAKLTALSNSLAARDEIILIAELEFINVGWLDIIINNTPVGIELTGFEFSGGNLTLHGQTKELTVIEEHRQKLIAAGLEAALGNIGLEDGLYIYTLSAVISSEV